MKIQNAQIKNTSVCFEFKMPSRINSHSTLCSKTHSLQGLFFTFLDGSKWRKQGARMTERNEQQTYAIFMLEPGVKYLPTVLRRSAENEEIESLALFLLIFPDSAQQFYYLFSTPLSIQNDCVFISKYNFIK